MYHEGLKKFPIRLLHVWDADGFVYLRIQNLQTRKVNKISWILQEDIEFTLWSIASLDYLMNFTNKSEKSGSTC
jgi:hypothetical protein